MYSNIKRVLDLVGSAFALLVAIPVMALVGIAVWIRMGRPVLFQQKRIGLNERPLKVYKFRTMINDRGPDGQLLSDEQRLTALGRFLRRSSLDELPQLWNILRGDLSFVGPRPLLPQYIPYYTSEERRRHEVRPGLTGWAQIHGRHQLGFDERLKMDVWYVDHLGLALDLKIVFKTVVIVMLQKGFEGDGSSPLIPLDVERAQKQGTGS